MDLVPGRSGEAYRSWLNDRRPACRDRVEIATLDPFHGYKNAINDQLDDARPVLDAFHVVTLATQLVDRRYSARRFRERLLRSHPRARRYHG